MAANDPHSPFRLGKRRIDTGVPGRPLGPDSPRALSQALSQPASRFPLSRSPEAGTDTDPGARPGRKGCREPDPVAPPHARRRRESRRLDGRPRPPRQVIRRPRGQRRLRTCRTAVPRSLAERSPGLGGRRFLGQCPDLSCSCEWRSGTYEEKQAPRGEEGSGKDVRGAEASESEDTAWLGAGALLDFKTSDVPGPPGASSAHRGPEHRRLPGTPAPLSLPSFLRLPPPLLSSSCAGTSSPSFVIP